MNVSIRKYLTLVTVLFLVSGCASKVHTLEQENRVGVATVVGTVGGVALGGMLGGMMGLLVTSGSGESIIPIVGLVVGAALAGSTGYGLGQIIDN